MASQWISQRDFQFLLYDVFDLGGRILGKGPYRDHDLDTVNMVLDAAAKLAETELAPAYPDEVRGQPVAAVFKDGQVYAPEAYHKLFRLVFEGGWTTLTDSPEEGGQGLPQLVAAAASEMLTGCNHAFMMYCTLTRSASHIVKHFCTEEQKALYLPRMLDGTFTGTMCLTEANAGSDVGALRSSAKKNPDGTYNVTGTKIFISAGDHDLSKNIIHLVLARIEGDPPGTKGVSIFLIPKYRLNADGSVGAFNNVVTGGIEHKLGIHGNATCTLNFGESGPCIGYLIGQPCEGIKIMFYMMNEARQGVGLQGVARASVAYLHALAYAKERLQGSSAKKRGAQVPIIEHPDVRRMLLKQKSIVEGIRCLCQYCYYAMDMTEVAESDAEKAKWQGLIEVLTPLVKAYCTDMGFVVNDLALQTYGGYGYCREYPVEQMLRDQRINSIYEGTNGIQALDLTGRKLTMAEGRLFKALLDETRSVVSEAEKAGGLEAEAKLVASAIDSIGATAAALMPMWKTNPAIPMLNAVDFLSACGDALVGWLHLWMAVSASKKLASATSAGDKAFYRGKIESAKFFINRLTSLVPAKCQVLTLDESSAVRIPDAGFAPD
jgi:alkylation response protein AidB-like acyl-CoA dehydrogenase